MKAAHGADSAEYGSALSNLGALYCDWADEPGQEARREQEKDYKTRALAITRKASGERHPDTANRHNNLAAMKAKLSDWRAQRAMRNAQSRSCCRSISRSIRTHKAAGDFLPDCWEQSGHADKAARLRRGDISDLVPVIAQIELEHRAWVAEDPENRHFGPHSYFVTSEDAFNLSLQIFAAGRRRYGRPHSPHQRRQAIDATTLPSSSPRLSSTRKTELFLVIAGRRPGNPPAPSRIARSQPCAGRASLPAMLCSLPRLRGRVGEGVDARVRPAHDEHGRPQHFFPSPLAGEGARAAVEHFPAKWEPVRRRKCDH